jgi:hypothetical protein
MRSAEFEGLALALVAQGYSPLVIAPRCQPRPDGRRVPEGKAPGVRFGGEWQLAHNWDKWCREQVSEHTARAWGRMIGTADDAGIGVALGRGLICIDIDLEEAVDPLLAILPPSPVQKKGRKGISLFYRGDTEKIRSKNFRTPERVGLVDLLAEGKQTVLPPSIHPDTGEPYYWWTDETLADYRPEELPELPEDIAEQIAEVLKPYGYDPDRERVETAVALHVDDAPSAGDAGAFYRKLNDDALANLDCWVPDLHLYRARRKPGGYEAVAHWRSSSTGRALELRKRNLSIVRMGIQDFGTGDKYTPIDLVMAAKNHSLSEAVDLLCEQLGYNTEPEIVLVNGPKTMEMIAERERLKSGTSDESVPDNTIATTAPAPARKHEKFHVTMFDDIEDSEKKNGWWKASSPPGSFPMRSESPERQRASSSRTRLVMSALAWIGTAARSRRAWLFISRLSAARSRAAA